MAKITDFSIHWSANTHAPMYQVESFVMTSHRCGPWLAGFVPAISEIGNFNNPAQKKQIGNLRDYTVAKITEIAVRWFVNSHVPRYLTENNVMASHQMLSARPERRDIESISRNQRLTSISVFT